ncbi:hypothetical protein [Streptomyces sp. H27-C3]|uniref:hypothetical protein n=1 Tax=Streptomyces sp. H27-C3 TaxID=3046305 RepID=UPI0032D981AD
MPLQLAQGGIQDDVLGPGVGRREGHEGQLGREGEQQVDGAAQEVVGPAAQVPRGEAGQDAAQHVRNGGGRGDHQGGVPAVEELREYVAARARFEAEPEFAVDAAVRLHRIEEFIEQAGRSSP